MAQESLTARGISFLGAMGSGRGQIQNLLGRRATHRTTSCKCVVLSGPNFLPASKHSRMRQEVRCYTHRNTHPRVRYTGRNVPPFFGVWSRREYPYSADFVDDFLSFSGQNAPKIHPGRPSRALWGQSGGGGMKECHFERFLREKLTLLGGFWGTFSAPFFCVPEARKKTKRRPKRLPTECFFHEELAQNGTLSFPHPWTGPKGLWRASRGGF